MYRALRSKPVTGRRQFSLVKAADAVAAHNAGKGFFVDVRHPSHVSLLRPQDGFTALPHFDFTPESVHSFPRNTTVYLMDDLGGIANEPAQFLEQQGFTDVKVVEGGFVHWFLNGGKPASSDPKIQEEFDYNNNAKTFPAIKANGERLGYTIDEDQIRLPRMEEMFGSVEAAEEAWNSLPRRAKSKAN